MEIFKSRQRKKAEKVIRLLTEKNLELATMESCTGGGLATSITDISGSGAVYQHGDITYSNFAKNHVGLTPALLDGPDGPYSADVAKMMAIMSLRDPFHPLPQNGGTIGVGITGTLNNPDRFYPHIPIGTVWVGIRHGEQTDVYQLSIPRRGRQRMKNNIINQTLDIIAQTIEPPKSKNRRGTR